MKLLLATCVVSLVLGYSAAAQTASNLLTGSEGKFVYDMDGNEIGQISAVHTDAGGKEDAVVETDQPLGMGVRQVLISSDSLQPKPDSGFVTSLDHAAIQAMPDYEQKTSTDVTR